VFEFSKEGIIVTDADRNIVSVNKSFSEITGYSATEVLGRNPKLLASGLQDGCFYQEMWELIHKYGSWQVSYGINAKVVKFIRKHSPSFV